jgi:phosphohistidine phosphatase
MRVYLVRHAKASKDPNIPTDAERPLTGRGRADAEQIAQWIAAAGIEIHQIRHSGLVRAQQTADIFGQFLKPAAGVIAVKGLTYADPVEPLAQEIAYETDPVMLVGHNPFMEQLAARLITGTDAKTPVSFGTSSVACLDLDAGQWVLKWALHRELVPDGEKD